MRLKTRRGKNAYHEAGHAILLIALGIECKGASIIEDKKSVGSVRYSGGSPREGSDEEALYIFAPEAYWLRLATAMYASAEAVRRAGYRNPRAGSGGYHIPHSDYGKAGDYNRKK